MLDGFVICNDYVLMLVVQVESGYLMRKAKVNEVREWI